MAKQPAQFEHAFRYMNRTVRLICSIETRENERRLVLEDVRATTQRIADGLPDWRLESEACKAALGRRAIYM